MAVVSWDGALNAFGVFSRGRELKRDSKGSKWCGEGRVDLLTVAVKGVNAMVMRIVRGGDNVV